MSNAINGIYVNVGIFDEKKEAEGRDFSPVNVGDDGVSPPPLLSSIFAVREAGASPSPRDLSSRHVVPIDGNDREDVTEAQPLLSDPSIDREYLADRAYFNDTEVEAILKGCLVLTTVAGVSLGLALNSSFWWVGSGVVLGTWIAVGMCAACCRYRLSRP